LRSEQGETHSPPQLPKSGRPSRPPPPLPRPWPPLAAPPVVRGRGWPRPGRGSSRAPGRAWPRAAAARLALATRARERGRFGESCVREREEERDLGEKINLFLPLSYYNNFLNILILLYVPLVFIS